MTVSLCVFDAYGTLFDVAAAAREAAAEPGREVFSARWAELAEIWRQKQLQYSWLRSASGIHTDFWQVTENGLDYALEATGLAEDGLRTRLLQLYWELSAFPEVPATLDALRADGRQTAILSNASPAMLGAAVKSAGLETRLDAWLSAESVGAFKPALANYALVTECFGVARREVLFVSSNGWDAWAATAFGFRTVWVNRKGEPLDRLTTPPDHVVGDLTAVPGIVKAL
ncbi:MAG: haloacid dehalogenase type II [Pseudomonadota bacterium]